MGTKHGNLHPAGWPSSLCGPTQEPCVCHSQHRRNRERFWNKCRWMDRKGRNKQGRNKSLAVSVTCMAIYWPTPGFKRECLISMFSSDGTLISASAVPPAGSPEEQDQRVRGLSIGQLWHATAFATSSSANHHWRQSDSKLTINSTGHFKTNLRF